MDKRLLSLLTTLLFTSTIAFEFPSICYGDSLNGTACCNFLQSQCVEDRNETVFNCSHGGDGKTGGNIFHLSMRKCGLDGTIPDTLTQMPYLMSLDLSGNFLIGSIPEDIGSLGKDGAGFKSLDLSENELEGTIPKSVGDEALTVSLRSLDLHSNHLSRMNMASVTSLVAIEYLDLSDNQIAENYHESLHSFPKLRVLNLGTNRFASSIPESVGTLSQLEVLNLERNDMTGTLPAQLSQMANLKTLNISDNRFTGSIPSEWADNWSDRKLEHLNIGNCDLDCPVADYSVYAVDSDFSEMYGADGESNCLTPSSDGGDGEGLDGVEIGIIVFMTIAFVGMGVYCWHSKKQQNVREQVQMLTEEDAFDD